MASIATTILFLIALGTHVATGWISRLAVNLSPAAASIKDPTLRVLDWSELLPAIADRGLLSKPRLFVAAGHRYDVSKIDVQLGKHLPVICLCSDPRNNALQFNHLDFLGWDALIIRSNPSLGTVQSEYGQFFRKIELLDTIDIHRGSQVALTLGIYYATDYYRAYPLR